MFMRIELKNGIKFLLSFRNLMSVSIGGGQVEQKAVRKSYQVEVAATATTMTLAHSHFTWLLYMVNSEMS